MTGSPPGEDGEHHDESRQPLNAPSTQGNLDRQDEDNSHFERPPTGQYSNLRSSDEASVAEEEHPLLYPPPPRGYYVRQHPMRITNWPRLIGVSIAVGLACLAMAAIIDVSTPPGGIEPGEDEKSVADTVLAAMDRSADPCSDFYEYACGSWSRAATIPPDKSRYAKSFDAISDRIRLIVREILENGMQGKQAVASNFYGACMTEMGIGSLKTRPLNRFRKLITGIEDGRDLAVALGTLHAEVNSPLFDAGVGVDDKNPERYALFLGQGGLGMSHRDNYLSKKEKYATLRDQYLTMMKAMLHAAGRAKVVARQDVDDLARRILEFETSLANFTIPPEDMRNPEKVYNKLLLHELPKALYVDEFLRAASFDVDKLQDGVIVDSPLFFDSLAEMVQEMSGNTTLRHTIQAYLAFHTTRSMAHMGLLGEKLHKANFAFHQATYGTKEMGERWKLCQSKTVNYFGEAVGAAFIEGHFSESAREFAKDMVSGIRQSFLEHLDDVEWMDSKTRKLAQEKMKVMGLKIGYNDELDTYDDVSFKRNDYEGGVIAAIAHEWKKELDRLGEPVDKGYWDMDPQEVNAYYSPSRNEIVFPAGILQQPFFSSAYPDAMNYGGIGTVVGHEVSHSVDDQGRQYDKTGRLSPWWTNSSSHAFETGTKCFVDLYNTYKPREVSIHVIGNLTLGENLADLGGVKVAYRAFQNKMGANASVEPPNRLLARELTNDQLFFVAYAQNYCENYRKKGLEVQMKTDPHSPGMFRVQGPLSEFKAFATAFKCKNGTKYNPVKRCEVWR
eukprot:Plantae.Rhodophyta-Hildenbrandia_rubra.ctg8326.p1 GENE.Plantae.Rhodophyta-Hildenbrandia_rubra.ctg8326~~Plantae.Rhodophyta-Hildenbrandia_rubra.ctg8326.p1  ORF type:complete len:786 (+),score=140.05 Plantae.Rhodophyta-Hildenbrandia_rubra.ctg8326:4508-6865(+)